MRTLRVGFNSLIGERTLVVPTHGELFALGERLAVSDDNTATFEAEVVEVTGDSMLLEVNFATALA